MLAWRFGMSAILVPAIVALFWLDQKLGASAYILLAFCLFVAVRNAYEVTDLLKVRNLRPHFMATAGLSCLVTLAGWGHVFFPKGIEDSTTSLLISLGWIGAALTFSFVALLAFEAWRYHAPGLSMESLGGNLLTVFYAGGLIAATAQLRWFPNSQTGYFAIASMIICVKCGDTFAYTFGRLWGKRKLAPILSPGKTRMGLAGAIFGSTLGGWLWLTYAGRLFDFSITPGSVWNILVYSAVIGLIGLVGDLCESLIKRDVQKKDSAILMPGFGGLLDLLDSPLFAGPFALAWWTLFPPVT
ncbi:MAG: phosphatidate cytidylyltransferase [Planctomycetaceae bacterium]